MSSSLSLPSPADAHPAAGFGPGRVAALLLLAQFAAMGAAIVLLGRAIDWPASLDDPPASMLPRLLAEAGPVFAGYSAYLLHALLLLPLAVALRLVLRTGALAGGTALALGVLAGFAKALGIARWIVLMPGLALAWADPATDEAGRVAIAVVYRAFNAYAGGVGELLGVGLFAGLWTALLAVALLRRRGAARWLGLAGLAAAALLLATLSSVIVGKSPALLTASGAAWQLWTLALAAWCWRARPA